MEYRAVLCDSPHKGKWGTYQQAVLERGIMARAFATARKMDLQDMFERMSIERRPETMDDMVDYKALGPFINDRRGPCC
jgi:hypothetical protein